MLYKNIANDLVLAKISKAFIELNSRRMNYCDKAMYCFAITVNSGVQCQIIVNGHYYL